MGVTADAIYDCNGYYDSIYDFNIMDILIL